MKRQIRLLVESLFDDEFNDIYDGDDIDLDLSSKLRYNYYPKTYDELKPLIKQLLDERGKDADFNDIDVSQITTFYDKKTCTGLFEGLDSHNIDISLWDVSNVEYMRSMFWNCKNFNCDLSRWDVSNVKYMSNMFYGCHNFTSDLSKWNVSNVEDMYGMFDDCVNFKSDLSRWDVSNVKNMTFMFYNCKKFNCDLSQWNIDNVKEMMQMFRHCKSKIIPKWYKKIK